MGKFTLIPFVAMLCVCFRDVDGVIRRANATEFGLASGVFTRDINKVSETPLLVVS